MGKKSPSSNDLRSQSSQHHVAHGSNNQTGRQSQQQQQQQVHNYHHAYSSSSNGGSLAASNSASSSSLIAPVGQFSGGPTAKPPMAQVSMQGINVAVETAAKKYRCAAQVSEATCCWKGKLPPKQYKTPIVYSTKVFVGGLPWDITEEDLVKEFGMFGPCRVEWTNKER
jgi:cytoplasmic polyadenylation element-binding protein